MRCVGCGWDAAGRDARFCGRCGAALSSGSAGDADPGAPGPRLISLPDHDTAHEGGGSSSWYASPRRLVLVVVVLATAVVTGGYLIQRTSPDAPVEEVVDDDPSEPQLELVSGFCGAGEGGCLRWQLVPRRGERLLGPVVFAELGYVAVSDAERGRVHGFRLDTGAKTWAAGTSGPVAAAPAVGGGIVVAVSQGDGSSAVEAFEALTGARRWRIELPGRLPGPVGVVADLVLVGGVDGVRALHVDTGEIIAELPADGRLTGTVLGHGGRLFYGDQDGVEAVDVATRSSAWRADRAVGLVAAEAPRYGVGGVVVVAHGDGTLAAYRGRDGSAIWERERLTFPTLPPLAEDLYVVVVIDGRFAMLEPWSGEPLAPARQSGAEPARTELDDPTGWALSGRTAYVTQRNGISSFDVRGGGSPLWSFPFESDDSTNTGPPVLSVDSVLAVTPRGLVALKR